MEQTISASEARTHFVELVQRVINEQQTIFVEQSGEPQIVILSIAQYERLKAVERHQLRWPEQLRQVRAQIATELGGHDLPPAETIIRQMRWVRLYEQ